MSTPEDFRREIVEALTSYELHLREEWARETEKIIETHNTRILNEFQLQGKPDMPMIAYDERFCLIPAMDKATKETLALLRPQESKEPTCKFCGCTESKACEGGCSWAGKNMCSNCVDESETSNR